MAEFRRNPRSWCAFILTFAFAATPAFPQAPAVPSQKQVGTVKAIAGNAITLTTDAGLPVNIVIQDSTRMVRAAPGQKDLKNAAPVKLQDLQVGDRMLVLGKPSDDGKSVLASNVIVMKGSDVTAKRDAERADWQKRGIGGLVTGIDAAGGTITVSTSAIGP